MGKRAGMVAGWLRPAALGLLFVLAACGGGGSGGGAETPPPDVPTTGVVTLPPAALVDGIDIGDEHRAIEVMPGDRLVLRLFVDHRDAADQYDVTVLEGGSFASVQRDGDAWLLAVDAASLSPGSAHAYRVQVRHRPSGAAAELRAPLRVAVPVVRASATVGDTGGSIVTDDGSLRLTFDAAAGSTPLGVRVLSADAARGRSWRIEFDRDVSADTRLLRIESLFGASMARATLRPSAASAPDGFDEWQATIGTFTTAGGYRLPDDKLSIGVLSGFTCALAAIVPLGGNRICVDSDVASRLSGKLRRDAPELAAAEPVLFVHGYQASWVFHMLGGDGWGEFPDLVEQVAPWDPVRSPRAFMFQWVTNASFSQVAGELAAAVVSLRNATGRPVTIVAHSFGGVLVRSLLQLHAAAAQGAVAQVVTLGSPHSGILPFGGLVDDVSLPAGLDPTLGGSGTLLCAQISCFQMGGPRLALLADRALGFAALPQGYWTAQLAKVDAQGGQARVPLVAGIGLGLVGTASGPVVGLGDGLISFGGQRLAPAATPNDPATGEPELLGCSSADRPAWREVVLSGGGVFPGGTPPAGTHGLVHTASLRGAYSLLLTHENEADLRSGSDLSLALVASVLRAGVCPLAPAISADPIDVTVIAGQPASFVVDVAGQPVPRLQWLRDGTEIPGANGLAVRLDATSAADDGALFSVIADNPAGRASSRQARLTVLPPPQQPPEPGPAKARLANCNRPCVLAATADGRLFGAGADPDANGAHPLGSPGMAPGNWFRLSSALPPVRHVTSGAGSSMIAGTDGTLWVTGDGSYGKLGDGGLGSATWKPVDGIAGVRAVHGRGITSYALTGDGQLWVTGSNAQGQLGIALPSGQAFLSRWTPVPGLADVGTVASDGVHTLVLRADKTVWAAGQNSRGSESVLGFGAGGDVLNIREWRAVPGLAGIVDLATGASHSLALDVDGRIWATGGLPSAGVNAFGWTTQSAFAPVPGIDGVVFITAANACSMAIKTDGSLWVAGLFGVGATGAGAGAPVSFAAWTPVGGAPPLAAVQTDCTRSIAIGRDGKLHVTGANEQGGIGLGNPQASGTVARETLIWTPIDSLGTGF